MTFDDDEGALLLGVAAADITPRHHVELAGFAARTGEWQRIGTPLALQAFAFAGIGGRGVQALLVCGDLLWWGRQSVDRIAQAVAAAVGVDADAVVLHATHTHAAPHIAPEFSARLGRVDPDYIAEVERRTVAACRRATERMVPVRLSISRGQAGAGIARSGGGPRGPLTPDPARPVDGTVTIVTAVRSDGEAHAALVHFACHPVTEPGPVVSADYPAVVRERLAAHLRGTPVVATLQSCAGDVNPAVLAETGSFRDGRPGDAEASGAEIVAAALAATASTPLRVGPVRTARHTVLLPVATAREPHGGVWAELAERRRQNRLTEPRLRLSALRLGPLTLLGLNAEVTSEVGWRLVAAFGRDVLPMTCTDGMIGYLVGPDDLTRGGYEAEESYAFVYRAGPWAPSAMATALAAIGRLLGAVGAREAERDGQR